MNYDSISEILKYYYASREIQLAKINREINKNPDNRDLYIRRTEINMLFELFDNIIEDYEKANSIKYMSGTEIKIAIEKIKIKRFGEAYNHILNALENINNIEKCYYNGFELTLVKLYTAAGDFGEAIMLANEIIERIKNTEYVDEITLCNAYYDLIDVFIAQKEYETALDHLNRFKHFLILPSDRDDYRHYYNKYAYIYYLIKDYEKCIKNYENAKRYAHPSAYYIHSIITEKIAGANFENNAYEKAIASYNEAIEFNEKRYKYHDFHKFSRSANLLIKRSHAKRKLLDFDGAIRDLEFALQYCINDKSLIVNSISETIKEKKSNRS